jgi:hypothetical protein
MLLTAPWETLAAVHRPPSDGADEPARVATLPETVDSGLPVAADDEPMITPSAVLPEVTTLLFVAAGGALILTRHRHPRRRRHAPA